MEGENVNEALKSQNAIRCAKAAILLSSLKCSSNRRLISPDHHHQEGDVMLIKREVEDLKTKLVRERMRNKKMKLCSVTELLLQIAILLCFWTLCLMLLINFL